MAKQITDVLAKKKTSLQSSSSSTVKNDRKRPLDRSPSSAAQRHPKLQKTAEGK